MYRIIGADGRQYGPVASTQVREWITSNRANAQTMVQLEGSTEWKPLGTVPEFSDLLGQAAPPLPPVVQAYDPRKSKLVAGLLGIFLGGFGVHRFYLGYTGIGIAQIVVTLATCGFGALWGLIEGILILVGSSITTDVNGQTLKEQ
jgi:TM2 domain-containing membrane protein YozV